MEESDKEEIRTITDSAKQYEDSDFETPDKETKKRAAKPMSNKIANTSYTTPTCKQVEDIVFFSLFSTNLT